MPGLKGSSAEFIINKNLPHYESKIIKLDLINQNTFLIGHIYGGINSSSLNPFSNNQTNLTNADNVIYEVWLTRTNNNTGEKIEFFNPYQISVYPIPFEKEFTIAFNLEKPSRVAYFITNHLGKIIQSTENFHYNEGENKKSINLKNQSSGIYNITIIFDNEFYVTQKITKN